MSRVGVRAIGSALTPCRGPLMREVIGYDGSTFAVGDRVEIHPGTDLWMMGARYGTVRKIVPTSEDRVRVEMDKVPGVRSGPADRFRALRTRASKGRG